MAEIRLDKHSFNHSIRPRKNVVPESYTTGQSCVSGPLYHNGLGSNGSEYLSRASANHYEPFPSPDDLQRMIAKVHRRPASSTERSTWHQGLSNRLFQKCNCQGNWVCYARLSSQSLRFLYQHDEHHRLPQYQLQMRLQTQPRLLPR